MSARSPLSLFLALAACAVPAEPPAVVGAGIVAADEVAPDGAEKFDRPTWRVGERFVLVTGERLRGELSVVGADEAGYTFDLGGGVVMRRDRDLGHLGKWGDGGAAPLREMAPVDARYHWPLWVGKRWRCEFVDRLSGDGVQAVQADYLVEGVDSVRVPAGEFQALRILRTLRLLSDEPYLAKTQITWYAPEPGIEVRHLLGETMVELAEWQRP